MRCDPLSSIYVAMGSQFLIWDGRADEVIDLTTRYLETVGFNTWVDDMRFLALLSAERYDEFPGVEDSNPEGSYFELPRKFYVQALENDIAAATATLETTQSTGPVGDVSMLIAEAMLGNREQANAYASKMDARFAGPFILAETVKGCTCGAPFDLDATPNFKQRIDEAGFEWPPASPIKYPAKDW
jgi:hypothetical protein